MSVLGKQEELTDIYTGLQYQKMLRYLVSLEMKL